MANINEKVYIGSVDAPTISFDQRSIEGIVCNNSVNLIGDELSSDVLEVSVFFDDADEVLRNTAYGTPVFYYSNDYLVGKYYVSEIERKGIKRYLIRSTSLIGLIEKEEFYGGFYAGDQFRNVVDDILFTNGVNLTKYKLYNALANPEYNSSSGSTSGIYYIQPVKVASNEPSVSSYKCGMHLEFTFVDDNRKGTTGSNIISYIAGRTSNYYVQCTVAATSLGNKYITELYVVYGNRTRGTSTAASGIKYGPGSKFTIDFAPVAGTLSIVIDYVDPDDSTITGQKISSWDNVTVSASTIPIAFNYAFGASNNNNGTSASRYSAILIWEKFQIFSENGNMIIDAKFATNESETVNYVANAANGEVVSVTSFNPTGNTYGTVSDFTRIERDTELSNSIVYGPGVENLTVIGWLRKSTRRESLHQLLFAEGVAMLKSSDGKIIFTKISSMQNGRIADDYLYDDSKEKSITPAKKISVTEHSYESTDVESEIIFDNSSSAIISGQYIVEFDKAPIFGTLVGNGITIITNNSNAAVVTGRGTITGTPYRHSKNVIRYISDVYDGTDVSVTNVGLITSINSDNIMSKLKSYYSGQLKKITNSILFNGERCGLKYLFKTLYSEENAAYLTKYEARTSSFVRANCEFISGFVPASSSGYSGFIIVQYGETWTVPAEVRSSETHTVRINLIGKGTDGTDGGNGSPGQRGTSGSGASPGGDGGAGGAAGVGGDGGYIYSITVDVTDVNKIVSSVTGYDTLAKTYDDSNALVSTYNSASGSRSDTGFMNIFTGVQYARKGKDGYAGGAGGKGGYCTLSNNAITIIKAESGGSFDSYVGGQTFDCVVKQSQSAWGGTSYYYNSYGGGGGAAYGNNGENAYITSESAPIVVTTGGDGANAIAPANVYTEYGSGGFGGNGGGGGGGAGTRLSAFYGESGYQYSTWFYQVGGYGTGSAGTPGIDGCLIIYY